MKKFLISILSAMLMVCVAQAKNDTIAIDDNPSYDDDDRLVENLDEYTGFNQALMTVIDSRMTELAAKLNAKKIEISLYNRNTGLIEAWITKTQTGDNYINGQYYKESTSLHVILPLLATTVLTSKGIPMDTVVNTGLGIMNFENGMTAKDHNWHKGGFGKIKFTDAVNNRSDIACLIALLRDRTLNSSKMWQNCNKPSANMPMICSTVSALLDDGTLIHPTFEGNNTTTQRDKQLTPPLLENIKSLMKDFMKKGYGKHFAPKGVKSYGLYCVNNDFTFDDSQPALKEVQYVVTFPQKGPRYTIGIAAYTDVNADVKPLFNEVNELVEYLK